MGRMVDETVGRMVDETVGGWWMRQWEDGG